MENASQLQNHLVNCLSEQIDFVGEASDWVGSIADELNSCIDAQDIQINQLANMVNDLVGKVEGQAKQLKEERQCQEEHCKVINTLTAKLITMEQCVKTSKGRCSLR